MQSTKIYETSSNFQNSKIWIARFIVLTLVIAASLNFFDNPFGLTIVVIGLTVVLALLYTERIEIFNDKFNYHRYYLFGLLTVTKTYQFDEVKFIGFQGQFNLISDVAEDVLMDTLGRFNSTNSIEVIDKANSSTIHKTRIYTDQLKEAFHKMYGTKEYVEKSAANMC